MIEQKGPNLKVRLGDIELDNPIIACSGTFSSGLEYSKFYDVGKLGAVTTKSFSLKGRKGNRPPRICETACGMLNSIGLENEGITSFTKEHLPAIKDLGIKAIVSIFGENLEEFGEIAKKIAGVKSNILAVELNLSCPNVEKGGMAFCSSGPDIKNITYRVKQILDIPVIVKLSPNVGGLYMPAQSAKEGGASAVSLVNTLIGAAFDINNFKPKLGNVVGGLSGPAIKPVACAHIYKLCRENILPVIGMGGVFSWEDAIEFLIAGAKAVGLGTVNFVNYKAGIEIIESLGKYLVSKNISDINHIIGRAHAKNRR
ncbi:MAG: dihydroorotate dehydrogenase [Actinomycetota bacterium]